MARARRGRGEGGVFQRESDGLWAGTVSLGYDGTGNRKRRVVYGHAAVRSVMAIGSSEGRLHLDRPAERIGRADDRRD
jgi:hypothetical protein